MAALSVTTSAVAVPSGWKDIQNVGPGRIAIDNSSGVTFATGLVLEVGGTYSASLLDTFYPDVWAIAESATSSLRYLI